MPQKEKKEFIDSAMAEDFVNDLINKKQFVVNARPQNDGTILVEWWPQATYLHDGDEIPDEIWVTRSGDAIQVSEMSEDHLRNTLRMILRNRREDLEAAQQDLSNALGDLVATLQSQLDAEGLDARVRMVSIDEKQIDEQIDALFPSDIKGNPTIH